MFSLNRPICLIDILFAPSCRICRLLKIVVDFYIFRGKRVFRGLRGLRGFIGLILFAQPPIKVSTAAVCRVIARVQAQPADAMIGFGSFTRMKPNIAFASYSLAVGSRNNHSASHNNPTETKKERNSRFSLQYPMIFYSRTSTCVTWGAFGS